jgi:hypothetical protein
MRQPQDDTTEGEQAQAQNNGGCGLCGARFRCHLPGSPYNGLTCSKISLSIPVIPTHDNAYGHI